MALFMLLLFHWINLTVQAISSTEDAEALLELKRQLTFNSSALGDWNAANSNNSCSWTGISCSTSTSRVISIHLGSLGFTGTISPALLRLTELQTLNLSTNHLTGPLDPGIVLLSNLKSINLANNNIAGPLPPIWSPSIEHLDLSHNNFTGPVPNICHTSGESQLEYLDMSGNTLSGQLPESFGSCRYLQSLQLCFNQLHGHLPASLANCTSLQELKFDWNDLEGEFFTEFPGLVNGLSTLEISGNRFTGELPTGLTSLIVVNLRHNSFSGEIPEAICSWGDLLLLSLGSNALTGAIPSCISELKNLQVLDLSNNRLSGILPEGLEHLTGFRTRNSSLWRISPAEMENIIGANTHAFGVIKDGVSVSYRRLLLDLKVFDLSGNMFQGAIPASLGELAGIRMLNLSNNRFQGFIPPELGDISNLLSLDLSHNYLQGEIPTSIAGLGLSSFSVAHNNLSGVIPTANVFNTKFDAGSFTGNPELRGCPLTSPCFRAPEEGGKQNQAWDDVSEGEPPGGVEFLAAFLPAASVSFCVTLCMTLFSCQWREEAAREAHLRNKNRVHPLQWLSSSVNASTGAFSRHLQLSKHR